MASIKSTKDAIKEIPSIVATHSDGEWRVTVSTKEISDSYSDKSSEWKKEKQEAIAYYTNDADDAVATAQKISLEWAAQKMKMNIDKERVYDIPNIHRDSAETMYARLRTAGFTPEWDIGVRDGEQRAGILIPQQEVNQLRTLQQNSPATWGNHPDVHKSLAQAQSDSESNAEINRGRMGALTDKQREFVEVIHYQTHLNNGAALDLNDRLHELSAQHLRLAQLDLNENGLSDAQKLVRDEIELQLCSLLVGTPGVLEPKFSYDPRGSTVGVLFDSGAHNSLDGSYKVPLNPERVKELAHENFQSAIEAMKKQLEEYPERYVVLRLENTSNAAFVDVGRELEVARIIEDAADKLGGLWTNSDGERYPLRDLNGNTVGHLELTDDKKATYGGVSEEGVKITIWCGLNNDAYKDDPAHEVAQHLREAATQIKNGNTDFPIYDVNGNHVGDGSIIELPSLEKNGVIDMSAALNGGDVYIADEGYSGIAEGEYRYVVPTSDFEPGYHQGEGAAWLVNANGELAPGYEEPQTVREVSFRQLNSQEQAALKDVVEGRVAFDEFERQISGDEPELN